MSFKFNDLLGNYPKNALDLFLYQSSQTVAPFRGLYVFIPQRTTANTAKANAVRTKLKPKEGDMEKGPLTMNITNDAAPMTCFPQSSFISSLGSKTTKALRFGHGCVSAGTQ